MNVMQPTPAHDVIERSMPVDPVGTRFTVVFALTPTDAVQVSAPTRWKVDVMADSPYDAAEAVRYNGVTQGQHVAIIGVIMDETLR